MFKKVLIILTVVAGSAWLSCGHSNTETYPTTGSSINADYELTDLTCNGNYGGGRIAASDPGTGVVYVQVAQNVVDACANIITPNIPALAAVYNTLPTGFDLETGDVNVIQTYGTITPIVAYQFISNGSNSYISNTDEYVSLHLSYDPSKVPSGDRTAEKLFVRILNYDDLSIANIDGTIESGLITVKLYGLPKQFVATVIYNPYMASTFSTGVGEMDISDDGEMIDEEEVDIEKDIDIEKTVATSWVPQKWCVIYNAASENIKTATTSLPPYPAYPPTALEIYTAMRTYAANYAYSDQQTYQNAGFSNPMLVAPSTSVGPCGSSLPSSARYLLYLQAKGQHFTTDDPGEVVSSGGNLYGRMYLDSSYITNAVGDATGSFKSMIANQMIHHIADTYGMYAMFSGRSYDGFREGTGSTFGATIDQGGTIPSVRSYQSGETELMSDFLSVNLRQQSDVPAISNQDFFAYVGREYGSNSLGYLSGLFQQIQNDVGNLEHKQQLQPPRSTMFVAMNQKFSSLFSGQTLKSIYLDFLKQRTLNHNANSQFGRSGEVTSGFASNLFQTSTNDAYNSLAAITVDVSSCSISSSSGGFGNVVPLAARAIQITPTNVGTARTITVTLTMPYGGIGDVWDGFTYNYSTGTIGSIAATNTFTSFGTAATDEIVLIPANITYNTSTYINYSISCS